MTNDDWRRALEDSEAALQICAVQTLACIERQRVETLPKKIKSD